MTCPKCSHAFVVLFDDVRDQPEALDELAIEPIDVPVPARIVAPGPRGARSVVATGEMPAITAADLDVEKVDLVKRGLGPLKVKTSIGLTFDFPDVATVRRYLESKRIKPTDMLLSADAPVGEVDLAAHVEGLLAAVSPAPAAAPVPVAPAAVEVDALDQTGRLAALRSLATDEAARPVRPAPKALDVRRTRDTIPALPDWAAEQPAPKRWPAVVGGVAVVAAAVAFALLGPLKAVEPEPIVEPVVEAVEAPVAPNKIIIPAPPVDEADQPGAVASDPKLVGKSPPSKPTPQGGYFKKIESPMERAERLRAEQALAPKRVERSAPTPLERPQDRVAESSDDAFNRDLLRLARAKHAAGDWGSAESAYRKLTDRDPTCADCFQGLGEVLVAQNRGDEAAPMFARAKAAAAEEGMTAGVDPTR